VGTSVLVVDDEADLLRVIASALKDAGCEVQTAQNGQQALDMCAMRDPEVILTDLDMPLLGGRAFVRAYRGLPTANARIVVMTSHDAEREAQMMGCDLGLSKPFSMDEVIAAVRYLGSSSSVNVPR
jgi:two-component system KDP operon response regulator KdpE